MPLQNAIVLILTTLSPDLPTDTSSLDLEEPSIPIIVTQSTNTEIPTTLDGRNWRHSYDIILTSSEEALTIYDEYGVRHSFTFDSPPSRENNSLVSLDANSGSIHQQGNQYHWTRTSGTTVVFSGSLPIRIIYPDDQTLTLEYNNGSLARVLDNMGNALNFQSFQNNLESVHYQSASNSCEQHSNNFQTSTDHTTEECNTENSPPPENFWASSVPGATSIDLRPQSCNSYFVESFGTTRGQEIEYGLDGHSRYARYSSTTRSFPIVDLIAEDELLVVRSRDLTSRSYDAQLFPEGLYRRLLQDAIDIQEIFISPLQEFGFLEATDHQDTTRVTHEFLDRPIVLEVIIRHGHASPEQITQINRARSIIANAYGIELRLVEIP